MRWCMCACVNASCDSPSASACDAENPHQGTLPPSALRRRLSHFCYLVAFARVAWVLYRRVHVTASHGANTLSQIERKRSSDPFGENGVLGWRQNNTRNCAGEANLANYKLETRGLRAAVSLSLHPNPRVGTVVWFGLESVEGWIDDDPWAPSRHCRRPAWREAIGTLSV